MIDAMYRVSDLKKGFVVTFGSPGQRIVGERLSIVRIDLG